MSKTNRINLAKKPIKQLEINFIEAQLKSFEQFLQSGFEELFDEINPILDYTGGSNWELHFEEIEWGTTKRTFIEAQRMGLTYEAPVFVNVKLINKKTAEIKKQKIFLTDFPLMGDRGSFMVNGNERVVVLQILRSEGILFAEAKASKPNKRLYAVKLMPIRGKWFDFEINKYGVLSVKLLDKHPKVLLTTLLRALGYASDEEIRKLLSTVDTGEESFVDKTLAKDTTRNTEEALLEIYRKLRPEDSLTIDNAKEFLENMFFNKRRFYLGKVGRYKVNQKLGMTTDKITKEDYTLSKKDIVEVVKAVIELNNGRRLPDDIDDLTNRRIRGVGEFIADKVRVGVLRMEKNIRDKMATYSTDDLITPAQLINTRPVTAAINQLFNSSALSRYMEQQNIFSELETKRRITAGGPKGLTKERATFSVRDVHNSHYSKICPVTTPEGPSIGMVTQMAVYARINEYGFLEAPYSKVFSSIDVNAAESELAIFTDGKRKLSIDLVDAKGKEIAKAGAVVTDKIVKAAKSAGVEKVAVIPFTTDQVDYLDADGELQHRIASANVETDENDNILDTATYVRVGSGYQKVSTGEVDYIDVSPVQIAGLGLALLPYSMNDDPNRTLIGAKTQNQAVPLVKAEPPIVGTGMERLAVKASGRAVFAESDGIVLEADASRLLVEYKGNGKEKPYKKEYHIDKFIRTNQNTCFSQNLRVTVGQKFVAEDVLVDAPCSDDGELALGVNLRTAYLIMDGMNYEDGIVISERVVKENLLTSVHIHEYVQDIRETKLGNELITRDIPNVGEHVLRNLDEEGVVRIGAFVEPRDILVGIVAPKGETELSAEEKLLRAIFGDYARDVRDNSLRVPYGEHGIVIGVQVLDKSNGDKLDPGVIRKVKVWVATTHSVSVGDKLTGFHGDKGIVTKILPEEDMPYTEDGKPVDIVVGASSMVRRMNLGQLREAYMARLAKQLGVRVAVPPFTEVDDNIIIDQAKKAGINIDQKLHLYDGRTGKLFDRPVMVGERYILKLDHLVDHKIHARSTGPYALVTQQPLGGRAQRGGQRFGEMEVWALEAHAVPTVLHEMLTIKSDDIVGRSAAYKSIITGSPITSPHVPESFNVLLRELMALGVKLEADHLRLDEVTRSSSASVEEIVDAIGNDKNNEGIAFEEEIVVPEGEDEINF